KDTTKTTAKPWTTIFEKTVVNNFHFRYKNQLINEPVSEVNFDDIDVHNFSAVVNNMDITHHLFKGDIQHLTLREKSGFYLKNLTGNARVDSNQVLVRNRLIKTPRSVLKDYFRMRFKSFKDFDDFVNKVHMDGDFKSSHISSADIAYFAAPLKRINFELGLEGRI